LNRCSSHICIAWHNCTQYFFAPGDSLYALEASGNGVEVNMMSQKVLTEETLQMFIISS
jgi:hypothetical protein